jgi:hypothetical protein
MLRFAKYCTCPSIRPPGTRQYGSIKNPSERHYQKDGAARNLDCGRKIASTGIKTLLQLMEEREHA